MKQSILSNWSFARFLRLVIGIAILLQAVISKDGLFGIAGSLFAGIAFFNMGCYGTGSCNTPNLTSKNVAGNTKDNAYK